MEVKIVKSKVKEETEEEALLRELEIRFAEFEEREKYGEEERKILLRQIKDE